MPLNRPPLILALDSALRTPTCTSCHRRLLHRLNAPSLRVPKPTPFVPDVPTFLTLIGRNLSQHASKIPSWKALFSLTSQQLRESGVEPARARRYLLWWRERFRNGITGIGGDLKYVKDGVAELRVAETPSPSPLYAAATVSRSAGMKKVVVNVVPTVVLQAEETAAKSEEDGEGKEDLVKKRTSSLGLPPLRVEKAEPVAGMKIVRANTISGTGVEPVKGYLGVARLKVKEGLWEERRGHKVDGGERRKAEVRYKRKLAERKNAR